MQIRNRRGGTLALIAAAAVVIVIIGVAFIMLMQLFSGSHELQNSIDSGNLQLTQNALVSPSVPIDASNPDQAQFAGVLDNGTQVNLGNINRVYGQALLVQYNALAMGEEGASTGTTDSNANKVTSSAIALGAKLNQAFNQQSNFESTFKDAANRNSIRMLLGAKGRGDNDVTMDGHQVAYTDAGNTANVYLLHPTVGTTGQIPDSIVPSYLESNSNEETRMAKSLNIGPNGQNCDVILGYSNNNDLGFDTNLVFVPLKNGNSKDDFNGSASHTISKTTFDKASTNTSGSGLSFDPSTTVPNSFMTTGRAIDRAASNKALQFAACSVAQARDSYAASIPTGYIAIQNSSCQNMSAPVGATGDQGQDLFTYLQNHPQYAFMGVQPHFTEDQGVADLIVSQWQAAYNSAWSAYVASGYNPNAYYSTFDSYAFRPELKSALESLTPAATNDEFKGGYLSAYDGPITNFNIDDTSISSKLADISGTGYIPWLLPLEKAYGLLMPGGSTSITPSCAHALELANFELLSQRSSAFTTGYSGQYASNVMVHPWTSGVTLIPDKRDPFKTPNVKFLNNGDTPKNLIYGSDAANPRCPNMIKRMSQRCYQIDPTFNGDLNSIKGWDSLNVSMGQSAYIYLDRDSKKLTVATAGNLPTWLQALVANGQIDGTTAAYDRVTKTVTSGGWSDDVGGYVGTLINHEFDWGYDDPYDMPPYNTTTGQIINFCNNDTYTFTPGTGAYGCLGQVSMSACFGLAAGCKNKGDTATMGHSVSVPGGTDCQSVLDSANSDDPSNPGGPGGTTTTYGFDGPC